MRRPVRHRNRRIWIPCCQESEHHSCRTWARLRVCEYGCCLSRRYNAPMAQARSALPPTTDIVSAARHVRKRAIVCTAESDFIRTTKLQHEGASCFAVRNPNEQETAVRSERYARLTASQAYSIASARPHASWRGRGLLAFENPAGIHSRLTIRVGKARTVADQ